MVDGVRAQLVSALEQSLPGLRLLLEMRPWVETAGVDEERGAQFGGVERRRDDRDVRRESVVVGEGDGCAGSIRERPFVAGWARILLRT